ncbi:MAG: RNA polymerase sigma factor [Limisphaerales bacterium]
MGDQELDVRACLERVRQRDQDAARDLTEHLYPLVIKIVRSHLPRRMDEQDLAQDIFLKIFAKLDQFKGDVPFEHWVSRVSVTTCLDKLRMQKRRPEWRMADLSEQESDVLEAVTASDEDHDPSKTLGAHELVTRMLEMLKPEDRMVVTLLDLEQKSLAEIAEITGWNKTLIKVRAFRARKKMR